MSENKQEPVAWASPHVIPLRGIADNHKAILTAFKCEANTIPLYTTPPNASARIIELESELSGLRDAYEGAMNDKRMYKKRWQACEAESKTRLDSYLAQLETNRVTIDKCTALENEVFELKTYKDILNSMSDEEGRVRFLEG